MTPQPSEQPRTRTGKAWLRMLRDLFAVFAESGATPDDPLPMILAIEAEAAAPDPVATPLDVERLASAIGSSAWHPAEQDHVSFGGLTIAAAARAIAAEYARLSERSATAGAELEATDGT